MILTQLLVSLAWLCSLLLTGYLGYFLLIALQGFRSPKAYAPAPPKTRFAVLVAARNEEAVIGNLVDSLLAQDYPRELYDVIVIPNNCTDGTARVAEAHGALVLPCTMPVKSKGEVLTYTVKTLLEGDKSYDNLLVFDADNLVHPGFLQAMNNAVAAGVRVAQGYRDSKNPHDTLMSGSYSIYYWMVNRFYSQARSRLGLNAIVNGSGFMVELGLLQEWGGWQTYTMTEDIEFTAQCALRGQRVGWVPQAITFDEQPLTFAQSWRQRKRWSTGVLQCLGRYAGPLSRGALAGQMSCADAFLFFLAPVVQLVWLLSLVLGVVLHLMGAEVGLFPETGVFYRLFFSATTSFLGASITSLLAIKASGKELRPMLGAMCYYWVFIISWVPINLLCLVRRTTQWEPIAHTRTTTVAQMLSK